MFALDQAKILCVDDESKNLKLLDALLSPRGYKLQLAENGTVALASLANEPPDLILLDIMMPDLSGYDVLKKIRADKKTRLIPVVMVTALQEVQDRVKALDAGCDDFISKPFDKIELLARVKSLLRISYYRNMLDEKEKFEAVIHGMGDGVVVCSGTGEIMDINESGQRYLNISDEHRGMNLADYLYKNYQVMIPREELTDWSTPHKIFDIVRPESKTAKALYLETDRDVLKNPEGEITSIVMTLRNVTDKRKEEMLKADFISMISHKLKTPLTALSGRNQLLQAGIFGALNEKQQNAVTDFGKYISHLSAIIDRLLTFVMVGQKKDEQKSVAIDLSEQIFRFFEQLPGKYPGKKISSKIDIVPGRPKILFNEEFFSLILSNLTDNAIKFNDKPEVVISLSVSVEPEDFVTFAFTDNGVGLPSEEYEKIFDKFYQFEKSFTGQIEGVGLGLTLVKELVEETGGTIKVESTLGKGTTFVFTLPATK